MNTIAPSRTERFDEIMKTRPDADLLDKSMENLLVCSDEGTMFLSDVEPVDVLEIDIIDNVSILYFDKTDDYKQFINQSPELKIIAYSEHNEEPCLIVQD